MSSQQRIRRAASTISSASPAIILSNPRQAAVMSHVVIESVAALNFFLRPSSTLRQRQPYAHSIIYQNALLLVCTNTIAVTASQYPESELTRAIAMSLAIYHLAPISRALARIYRGEHGQALGGPWLHLVVHVALGAALVMTWVRV